MEKRNFRDWNFNVYRSDSANPVQIIILHGICEHSFRYIPFIKNLNKEGYDCALIDHPGHGQNILSDGFDEKLYDFYDSLEDDLSLTMEKLKSFPNSDKEKEFQKHFAKINKQLRLETLIDFQKDFIAFLFSEKIFSRKVQTFILGQSMGGLIASSVSNNAKGITGTILLSPALKAISKPLNMLSKSDNIRHKIENKVITKSDESFENNSLFKTFVLSPLLSLNPVSDCSWAADFISDIPEINEVFSKDPFIGRKLSFKFLQSIQKEMKSQRETDEEYKIPVFIEYGTDDKIVNAEGSEDFINKRLQGKKHFFKALKNYQPHEIHNSKRRNYLINDIKEWTASLT